MSLMNGVTDDWPQDTGSCKHTLQAKVDSLEAENARLKEEIKELKSWRIDFTLAFNGMPIEIKAFDGSIAKVHWDATVALWVAEDVNEKYRMVIVRQWRPLNWKEL